jgi:BON domain-containing protein
MTARVGLLVSTLGGAALMFLLDPQAGGRRRARLRDQAIRAAHRTSDAVDVTSRDVTNRARGVVAHIRGRLRNETVTDPVLDARVRSRIGAVIGHAGAIDVAVRDGRVTLGGPVLASEVDRLLRKVRGVRGVKEIESLLEVHETPGDVPALQGRPRPPRRGEVFELLQTQWSPAARLAAGVTGGAISVAGIRRGGLLGPVLTFAGTSLLYRAVTNRPLTGGALDEGQWRMRVRERIGRGGIDSFSN